MRNFRTQHRRIKVEFSSVRVISSLSQRYAMRCGGCCTDVEAVPLAEAATIARTSTDEIIAQAARGNVHLGICAEAVLFCLDSLLKTGSPNQNRKTKILHEN